MSTVTTTLTWVRYDGTPETLPGVFSSVLLLRDMHIGSIAQYIDESGRWSGLGNHCYGKPRVGDIWAHLPVWFEVANAMRTAHDAPRPEASEV